MKGYSGDKMKVKERRHGDRNENFSKAMIDQRNYSPRSGTGCSQITVIQLGESHGLMILVGIQNRAAVTALRLITTLREHYLLLCSLMW